MKYFSIDEMCKTSTGIPNNPTNTVRSNLAALIENVLDPLRESYGKPIKVNSGYRSKAVNAAVNGAASSQHVTGEAADISAGSPSENKKLFDILCSMNFDQIINEHDYTWVHVSFSQKRNRKQRLEAVKVGGKTIYKPM